LSVPHAVNFMTALEQAHILLAGQLELARFGACPPCLICINGRPNIPVRQQGQFAHANWKHPRMNFKVDSKLGTGAALPNASWLDSTAFDLSVSVRRFGGGGVHGES
jgi:hypothetical protein